MIPVAVDDRLVYTLESKCMWFQMFRMLTSLALGENGQISIDTNGHQKHIILSCVPKFHWVKTIYEQFAQKFHESVNSLNF